MADDEVKTPFGFSRSPALKSSSSLTPLEGFGKSAVSSMVELFGADPLEGVESYRRKYPTGGVVSQFIGVPVPYIGWGKIVTKVPALAKKLDKVTDLSKPFRSGVKRELVRFAPFEAGRAGTAIALGNDPIEELEVSAINLGAGMTIGGGLQKLAAAGKKPRYFGFLENESVTEAPQNLYRGYSQALAKGELPATAELNTSLKRLSELVRTESAPTIAGKQTFVAGTLEDGADAQGLNRLFKLSGKKAESRKLIRDSGTGFSSSEARDAFVAKAELPQGWEGFAQYPRRLVLKEGKKSKALEKQLFRSTRSIQGDDWRWTRESDTGMFVLARKVEDDWLLFKTHDPRPFVREAAKWTERLALENAYKLGSARKPIGSTIYDTSLEESKVLNETAMGRAARSVGQGGKGFGQRVARELGMEDSIGPAKEALVNMADEYFAPLMFKYRNAPHAGRTVGLWKTIYDKAGLQARRVLFGKTELKNDKNLYRTFAPGLQVQHKGGLKAHIDEFEERDLAEVWRALNEEMTLAEAADNLDSLKAIKFLRELQKIDDSSIAEHNAIAKATGNQPLKALPQHYMIARTWRGDHRVPVYDNSGRMIHMASGYSRKQAQAEAEAVVAELSEGASAGKAQLAERADDAELAAQMFIKSPLRRDAKRASTAFLNKATTPKTFKKRAGVGGYEGQNAAWTKDELVDILSSHVYRLHRRMAEMTAKDLTTSELTKIASLDPVVFERLQHDLNNIMGIPGPVTKIINESLDKVIGGIAGKNSATKITATANNLMFNWQLGAFNTTFPIVNAFTFLMTVNPQAAFVMNAPRSSVAKYYSSLPALGADGQVKGVINSVNPMKMSLQAFRELGNPSDDLVKAYTKAGDEGVWDPKMIEEFVGENAQAVGNIRQAFKDGSYVKTLTAASEALPAASEKFSRGHAFTAGYILGRDFQGLQGEGLYRFAKEFTNNTMFSYGTVDRARIITGPLGGLFGLFKNWQMHYMYQMFEYAGLAAKGAKEGDLGYMKPLLWQMAGTAATAGVGGLPLVWAADWASEWMTDESVMFNIYDGFGDQEMMADGVYMGLPALLGLSLQGSGSAPDPVRDASLLFSFVHWDRAQWLGRAVGTAIDQWDATGRHPIQSRVVADQFVRALAPRSIYRVFQGMGDRHVRSLKTGNPMISDLSFAEHMAFMMGLNPVSVEKAFKAQSELWAKQDALRTGISSYGEAVAEAMRERDNGEVTRLLRRATVEGFPVDSILSSAQTRQRNNQLDQASRMFKPEDIAKYQQAGLLK